MPCDSSYMEPTAKERKAAQELSDDLTKLADGLVYTLDVVRGHILGEEKVINIGSFINNNFPDRFARMKKRNSNLYDMVALPSGRFAAVERLVKQYVEVNKLLTRQDKLTPAKYRKLVVDQNQHREDDLRRLMRTFADAGDRQRLKKVLDADNTKPLAPQLGFDPDDF